MNKRLLVLVTLLCCSVPGFSASKPGLPNGNLGSTTKATNSSRKMNSRSGKQARISRSNQFRFNRTHISAKANSKPFHPHAVTMFPPTPTWDGMLAQKARLASSRRTLGSSTSANVSFVAGARTALGGSDDDETEAVIGDFNGDGKMDVAKIVTNTVALVNTYQIAILLGNGDGTFQTATLINTDGNTDDPIFVGDLKGDGTDDIIQVHSLGGNCDVARRRAQATRPLDLPGCGSSIDVLLSNGDGTFATPINYSITGNGLAGGTFTDINGDGKLDLLILDNATPANIIAVLGNGDGTFQTPTTLGQLTTSAPNNILFADFNGDGKIDFAGQTESGQLQVTLATGAGLYANPPASLTTPDGVYAACNSTAGSLTSATVPEIVSFNCQYNSVTVYSNNGDGSFGTGVYYNNNGDLWQDIYNGTIADMNGDGKNDIVVINDNTADISVFLGNGDGTVAVQPLRYAVGGYAWEPPLVADFNGDGLLDVVESDDEYNLVYLQGYGEGTFKAAPTYSLPNSFDQRAYTEAVATGDFNGDGIPDVVVSEVGNSGSTGVTVYLGRGDGTFSAGVSYGPSSDMIAVAVGDFNGDGKLDIAAIDDDSQSVQILLGNGDGSFSIAGLFATDSVSSPYPNNLVVGDFNKDGKLDIAVSNYDGNVGVLLGHGDGSFAGTVSYSTGEALTPASIVAADINGDGYLDLAVPSYSDGQPAVAVFLGNTDNSGTFQAPTSVSLNGEPNFAAIGDLNGDGKLDMAVTERDGLTYDGQVEVFLGNGNGGFSAPVAYQASLFGGVAADSYPANIAIADVNGDGKLDLVYLNSDWGTLAVAAGNGDGTVAAPIEFPTTEDPWGMAMVDLTGDGAMDVLTGDDDGGGFNVMINGNGSAANPNYSIGTQTPSQSVTAGGSATYTVNLAGTNGYNGTVTFSCGNLPAGTTCSFSPSSVVANGAVPQTTTLTITTTASASAQLVGPNRPEAKHNSTIMLASLSSIGVFGMFLLGGGKKRTSRILGATMMLLMLCTLVGCSGTSTGGKGSGSGTPAGQYAVAVTSTGTGTGAPSHTLTVMLVVQ
jgi:hypothetical protein